MKKLGKYSDPIMTILLKFKSKTAHTDKTYCRTHRGDVTHLIACQPSPSLHASTDKNRRKRREKKKRANGVMK